MGREFSSPSASVAAAVGGGLGPGLGPGLGLGVSIPPEGVGATVSPVSEWAERWLVIGACI